MAGLKKLPIGIENFEEMRREDFYYVDKSHVIEQLLTQWGKVNLFTRPRRFGKSLNMSMLQSFFEIGKDKTLFDGLRISDNQELCEKYQGKFPVVSVSLKGINGATYEEARRFLIKTINEEARRLSVLSDSTELDETDHELLIQLKKKEMTNDSLVYSIRELTELLEKHYGSKVIVLIDEYDVPLAKANENGYYDEMVLLIRNLFENALKTNSSLKFAVLTGCLRIAKESIFTGLNNFKVYSITDKSFDETFGFTDAEVRELLRYYGQEKYYETVKEWYDGYRFGNVDVYCPWDVINFCSDHLADPGLEPKNYWANTSGNSVISHFIDSVGKPQKLTRMELEQLVNGGIVQKEINSELTYKSHGRFKESGGSIMSEVKKIATRESYGNALIELGKEHENLVVLDADLAAATKTGMFKKVFPERHIDCGIAECNMVGIAAGLATTGMVPFASTFAMFAAGRAFEQIRNSVGYPHLNVKIGATHAGISVGEDGATHQCNEDIALMRTIPGMTIINPSDDVEAKAAVRAAYELDGPVYLRFGRLAVPVINDNDDYKFEIGKGVVLREGLHRLF